MPRRRPLTREEQNAQRRAFYENLAHGGMSIATAAKAMRAMTGLTQTEFADHRGVSRRVIQEIESGKGNPTVDSLNAIGKLFGVHISFVPIKRTVAANTNSSPLL